MPKQDAADAILDELSDKPVADELPQRKTAKENRKRERYLLHWKIAVVYEHNDNGESKRFYGKTFDVSLTGTSIYSDHNIFVEGPIIVLISMPSPDDPSKNKMLEIKSRMAYTYLCSNRQRFRTGIQFTEFKGDGKELLKALLDKKIPAGNTLK
jgi:hypothetical protein